MVMIRTKDTRRRVEWKQQSWRGGFETEIGKAKGCEFIVEENVDDDFCYGPGREKGFRE